MIYEFKPNFQIIKNVQPTFSIQDFEKEIGVYSASPQFIKKNCGPITNMLLNQIPDWYFKEAEELKLYPNCDIRIHRLYPGDYPAYPGFHCDGEYRETYFSQPDLNKIKVHKHIICTISSHEDGISNCQFLNQNFSVNIDKTDQEHTLWGQIHKLLMKEKEISTFDTLDGQMILFDSWTLHKVMPAKIRGWRLFFRMSMWHKPNLGYGGMITKQEQVYKIVEGNGW